MVEFRDDNFITTSVEADGVAMPVVLDTGSNLTCVEPTIITQVDGGHPDWQRLPTHDRGLCGGSEQAIVGPDPIWSNVHLGTQTLYALSGKAGPERSGLLGTEVLKNQRVLIAYSRKVVTVSTP
jgi:hypothetical protein